MDAKAAADSRAEITQLMGVTDANNRGNIHGGTIMKLADEAAALAAIKHSRQRVVTVGMDRMDFLVPIYVGELVTFRATVNAAWRTSMEVGVRVEAELRRANRLAEREEIIARRAQEARRTARDDDRESAVEA